MTAAVRSSAAYRRRIRLGERRGVLLLIVLSMLILFMMIGVYFVMMSSRARTTSKAMSRLEQSGDQPQKELDSVFMDIVRGPATNHSPLLYHDLLGDVYGHVSLTATLDSTGFAQAAGTNGAILDATFTIQNPPSGFTHHDGDLNGQLLTVVGGEMANYTTRIIESTGTSPTITVRTLAFRNNAGATVTLGATANKNLIINGRPFSGTGAGYDVSTTGKALLDAKYTVPDDPAYLAAGGTPPDTNAPQIPYALLPNTKYFSNYATAAMVGGLNEDYDAADYQNMFMALIAPGPGGAVTTADICPSFHRPALVAYMKKTYPYPTTSPNPDTKTYFWPKTVPDEFNTPPSDYNAFYLPRAVIQRPLKADHPNFTGSNPNFNPVTGPWDVDNLGTGVADSIWIDPGLPVMTAKDGRLYKRLVAPLILDLDGRLNLNAHGSTMEIDQTVFTSSQTLPDGYDTTFAPSVLRPLGQGYGPVEIRLSQAITAPNELKQLLRGTTGTNAVEGRYGVTEGPTNTTESGQAGITNTQAVAQFGNVPANYSSATGTGFLSYGSPPDLWGRGTYTFDLAGQPYFMRPVNPSPPAAVEDKTLAGWASENTRSPYELNLSRYTFRPAGTYSGAVDNPFSPGELERVLRGNDYDAQNLPSRIVALAPMTMATTNAKYLFTTDSWDMPVIPGTVPVPGTPPIRKTVAQLLRDRLQAGGGLTPAQIETEIPKMLPPEILAGLKFDINRPFTNLKFVSGAFIMEDSTTSITGNPLEQNGRIGPVDADVDLTNGTDINNDGNVDYKDRLLVRQLYARYLYVMMMLLADHEFMQGSPPPAAAFISPQNLQIRDLQNVQAHRVAQWAINVVDFRDADGIMTPFIYPYDPFLTGWKDVPAEPGAAGPPVFNPTTQGVVWGCEAPDLLITETLATHDRRVADSANDDNLTTGGKKRNVDQTTTTPDEDYDQLGLPEGSLFVELYCPPKNQQVKCLPKELYTDFSGVLATPLPKQYLELAKMAPPDPNGHQYPVWRLAIGESRGRDLRNNMTTRIDGGLQDSVSFQPDEMNTVMTQPGIPIERIIWFTDLTTPPATTVQDYNKIFWSHPTAPSSQASSVTNPLTNPHVLEPGHYLVVGPRPTTFFGLTTAGTAHSSQQIRLQSTATDETGITVNVSGAATTYPVVPPTANPEISTPKGLVVAAERPAGDDWAGRPIGLSVSEPMPLAPNYYPYPKAPHDQRLPGTPASDPPDAYGVEGNPAAKLLDKPLDQRPGAMLVAGEDNVLPINSVGDVTVENYKHVFLQRLADPTRPYDRSPFLQSNNPYITVDWSPIDLHVFNGTAKIPVGPTDPPADRPVANSPTPLDAGGYQLDYTNPPKYSFSTRQRSYDTVRARAAATPTAKDVTDVWKQATVDPTQEVTPAVIPAGTNFFDAKLVNTLGYLNSTYQFGYWPSTTPGLPPSYIGSPKAPVPSLTWNNRPFISAEELMLVPTSSPGRLFYEYGVKSLTVPYQFNPYQGTVIDELQSPYAHLLNFFQAEDSATVKSAHFGRIFDFVRVPSRFSGTDTWLDPAQFGLASNWSNAATNGLRAPFNRVSNYRDPGKININTITSRAVWDAVLGGDSTNPFGPGLTPQPHPGLNWNNFVEFRRGYTAANILTPDTLPANSCYPTNFVNIYRDVANSSLAPPLAGTNPDRLRFKCDTYGNFLRRDGNDLTNVNAAEPLFATSQYVSMANNKPYNNALPNPTQRYAEITRLSNLLTTRSNVYAVWLTVGYFEVTPGAVDLAHPDGYRLGQELGIDTGEVVRHRAFYIYDRSLPVGYQPGIDHNATDGILLKRFIE